MGDLGVPLHITTSILMFRITHLDYMENQQVNKEKENLLVLREREPYYSILKYIYQLS